MSKPEDPEKKKETDSQPVEICRPNTEVKTDCPLPRWSPLPPTSVIIKSAWSETRRLQPAELLAAATEWLMI